MKVSSSAFTAAAQGRRVTRVSHNPVPSQGRLRRAARLAALFVAITAPAYLVSGCALIYELAFPPKEVARAQPKKLGTVTLAEATPSDTGATEVDDAVLSGRRGAYNGIEFSVLFNGSFDSNGTALANLSTSTSPSTTVNSGSQTPSVQYGSGGDVQIQTSIGNFAGANGIFQIAQVPGNFNVVNNNLFIQVNILQDAGSVPSLSSLLSTSKF